MHVRVLVLSATAAGLVAVAGCGGRGIGPSVTPEKARQDSKGTIGQGVMVGSENTVSGEMAMPKYDKGYPGMDRPASPGGTVGPPPGSVPPSGPSK